MKLFDDIKLASALKDYKFSDAVAPASEKFSKEFEVKMERFIRQKQRSYKTRIYTKRAAAAVVTIALFGSFLYLLLLPRNAENSTPFNTEQEQAELPEPEPTPEEFLSDVGDDCECCPDCIQEDCVCEECGDSDDCVCFAPEEPELPLAYDENKIEVANAEELVSAIAPNTTITLEHGTYDVSTLVGFESPYVRWHDDGYSFNENTLVIYGVDGLTLQAAPGAEVEIVTPYMFAEVFAFSDCNGISLIGIKAGHTVTGEYVCDAGVLSFKNCTGITVENCYLYGCGTVGLNMYDCSDGLIKDTTITDCSRAAAIIENSKAIEFLNCKLIDNRAYQYVVCIANSSISFNECVISGNKSLMGSVFEIDFFGGTSEVLFNHCLFVNNAPDMKWFEEGFIIMAALGDYAMFDGRPNINVKDCEIELGQFSDYWRDGDVTDLGGNILR